MKQCFKFMAFAFCYLICVACSEEQPDNFVYSEDGVKTYFPVSLNTIDMTGESGTKSVPGEWAAVEQTRITDVWIVEYNKDTDQIVGSPTLYSKDDIIDENGNPKEIPVVLPPAGQTYTFVAIANANRENLQIGNYTSLTALKTYCNTISSDVSRLYLSTTVEDETSGEERKYLDLIMSGEVTIKNDGTNFIDVATNQAVRSLTFPMYRNVAKLSLTIKNTTASSDGVNIKSVRLCNVPSAFFYAEVLRNKDSYDAAPVPGTDEVSFFDMEEEKCEISAGSNGSQSFTFYLPRNCRGVNTNSSADYTKNQHADKHATFVEILAETTGGLPVKYRFYLGNDMVDDFNVMPNHHYILPITINSTGSSADSRVELMGTVLLAEANSYIINHMSGTFQRPYAIDVSTRSNRYWSTILKGANGKIDENTEWVAEVIWQDVNQRLIYFCDDNGNIKTEDKYYGKGFEYLRFKLDNNGACGNVLIGVKPKPNAGETESFSNYLWSWHLWITDYNPDEAKDVWGGDYEYTVPGGEVHRYDDGSGYSLWKTNYNNKWIMDRNLGAMEEDYTSYKADFYKVMGNLYQFGRKDPFPRSTEILSNGASVTYLYDIDGSSNTARKAFSSVTSSNTDFIAAVQVKAQTTIATSINTPYVMYCPNNTNWISTNDYCSEIWNNPTDTQYRNEIANDPNLTVNKSLFDPCPPGWMIPEVYVWSVFTWPSSEYYRYGYDMNMTADSDGPKAFYPAQGCRHVDGGGASLRNLGSFGYYWVSTPVSTTESKSLLFDKESTWRYPTNYARQRGFPVRCIQE